MKTRMVTHNHGARIDTAANDEDPTSVEFRRRVIEAEEVPEQYSLRALVFCTAAWIVALGSLIYCVLFGSAE